jgi:transcriptional regulator with XRE-family HTH domain
MKIDPALIRDLRESNAWSQEDLAREAGLNPRTIQRIERTGTASLHSQRSLAAALDVDPRDLAGDTEHTMSPCPECRSSEVYGCTELVDTTTIGGELLPQLSPRRLSSAKIRPVICADCGHLRFFVEPDALERLHSSDAWELV